MKQCAAHTDMVGRKRGSHLVVCRVKLGLANVCPGKGASRSRDNVVHAELVHGRASAWDCKDDVRVVVEDRRGARVLQRRRGSGRDLL